MRSVVYLFAILSLTWAAPAEDEVHDLPGLNFEVNFKHYSGYLEGNENKQLHYWFFESSNNPSKDPVVLWLNGGPGCSSMMGLLTENGPFWVNDGVNLQRNEHSWNTVANMLYMESPACVGFSYDTINNMNCQTGDIDAAEGNYKALKSFFKKFPEFKDNEFFISGESYAGIYIPTLSEKIVQNQDIYYINLKGYIIGNGMSEYLSNSNSLIWFANYHGLLGTQLWSNLKNHCCDENSCNFGDFSSMNFQCDLSVSAALTIIYGGNLNVYGLYQYCPHPDRSTEYYRDLQNLLHNHKYAEKFISMQRQTPQTRGDPPCVDSHTTRTFLNNPEVRKALHIPEHVSDWEVCSDLVGILYQRDYDSMKSQHLYLQKYGIRGIMYNGDIDMACNFIGQEWFIEGLGLKEREYRRMWFEDDQVAGFVKQFENITLMTVLGAGHMVPTDEPSRALHMFKTFIEDGHY